MLRKMLWLLVTMVLGAMSFPVITKEDRSSIVQAKASLLQALDEWTNDPDNPKTAIDAKGEMERLLVHRHLLDNVTHEVRAQCVISIMTDEPVVLLSPREMRCRAVPR